MHHMNVQGVGERLINVHNYYYYYYYYYYYCCCCCCCCCYYYYYHYYLECMSTDRHQPALTDHAVAASLMQK